jgi:hypothetical protein
MKKNLLRTARHLIKLGVFIFIPGKGQYKVVVVGNGEFGDAVKSLLQTVDDGYLFPKAFEEGTDVRDLYIEQQGAAPLVTMAQTGSPSVSFGTDIVRVKPSSW